MRPHKRQPTRLPHPWDSPGKNTGVGCHFLLQCIKVKSESEVAQSCPTLSDPMDCSLPGSSIYGIFQARVLEWGVLTIYLILAQCHFPWTWLPISPVFFPFCPYLTRRWGGTGSYLWVQLCSLSSSPWDRADNWQAIQFSHSLFTLWIIFLCLFSVSLRGYFCTDFWGIFIW